MGIYDRLLVKALTDGDRDFLEDLIKGKAVVKAHFRRDPQTGKLIHIKEHEREVHKTHTVFKVGDMVRALSGGHAGKIMEIKGYAVDKNVLRVKHGDNPNLSISPHLVEHVTKTAENTPGDFAAKEESITEPTPYDLGKQAFEVGKDATPAHDPEIMKLMVGDVGSNVENLKQWLKGWHEANAAAPVPEVEEEDNNPPPITDDSITGHLNASDGSLGDGDDPVVETPIEEPAEGFDFGEPKEPVKELSVLETIQGHIDNFLAQHPGWTANKWDNVVESSGKIYYYFKKNFSDAGSAIFNVATGKFAGGKLVNDSVAKWAKDLYKFQVEEGGVKFGPEHALEMIGIKVEFNPKYGTVLKGNTYNYAKYIKNIVGGKYVGDGTTKVQWPSKLEDLAIKITPFEKGDFDGQNEIPVDVQHGGQPAGGAVGSQPEPDKAGGGPANSGGAPGSGGVGGYGASVYDEVQGNWSNKELKKKTIADLIKMIHKDGIGGPPNHVKLSQEVIDSDIKPMEHQISGAEAALSTFDKGSAGFLLGDSTGTGKTFTAAAVIAHMKPKRCLIVCPSDIVIDQWLEVLKKAGIIGTIAKGNKTDFSRTNGVMLTTYNSMSMNKSLHDVPRDLVVFDETHFMKNLAEESAQRAENGYNLVKKQIFNNGKVLYMTATPYEKPQQAKIFAALGMWKTTPDSDEFNNWVEQRGVKVHGNFKTIYEKAPPGHPGAIQHGYNKGKIAKKIWTGKQQHYTLNGNGDSAKKATLIDFIHNIRAGKYLTREVLPEGVKMDNVFTAHDMDPYTKETYNFVMGIFDKAIAQAWPPKKKARISGQRTMWSRRFCEHAKIPGVIELAKKEMAAGRSVSIMTGYKAEADTAAQVGKLMGLMSQVGIPGPMMHSFKKKLEEMGAQMEGSVKVLKEAFPEAVELHGGIPIKQRLKNVKKFNAGEAKMIICTQATADTGLSLHDTIGTHPRSQINVTLPWSGMAMQQLSGRSHRLGSKSDTNMHWVYAKVPDEQHRANIMALKLKILGASAKGIDVDTSDEAYKKTMEFILKGDIDDPNAKLLKSLADMFHILYVEDLIKSRGMSA